MAGKEGQSNVVEQINIQFKTVSINLNNWTPKRDV